MTPVQGEPWPVGRDDHAACCLNYGEDHPQLLVYGGRGNGNKTLGDMWILDVDTGKCTEVRGWWFRPTVYNIDTTTVSALLCLEV